MECTCRLIPAWIFPLKIQTMSSGGTSVSKTAVARFGNGRKNDYNLNQIGEITYYYKSSGGAAITYK